MQAPSLSSLSAPALQQQQYPLAPAPAIQDPLVDFNATYTQFLQTLHTVQQLYDQTLRVAPQSPTQVLEFKSQLLQAQLQTLLVNHKLEPFRKVAAQREAVRKFKQEFFLALDTAFAAALQTSQIILREYDTLLQPFFQPANGQQHTILQFLVITYAYGQTLSLIDDTTHTLQQMRLDARIFNGV